MNVGVGDLAARATHHPPVCVMRSLRLACPHSPMTRQRNSVRAEPIRRALGSSRPLRAITCGKHAGSYGALFCQDQCPVAAVPQPREVCARQANPPRLGQQKVRVVVWRGSPTRYHPVKCARTSAEVLGRMAVNANPGHSARKIAVGQRASLGDYACSCRGGLCQARIDADRRQSVYHAMLRDECSGCLCIRRICRDLTRCKPADRIVLGTLCQKDQGGEGDKREKTTHRQVRHF